MKNTILLICLLMLFGLNELLAQGWERVFEDGHQEILHHASASPDGGVVLAGVQDSTNGDRVTFIYRVDDQGNRLWTYYDTARAGEFLTLDGFLTLSDGSILFTSSSPDTSMTPIDARVYLQKLSPAGAELWSVVIDDNIISEVGEIFETEEGNIVIVGGSSWVSLGGIISFDQDGQLLWENTTSVINNAQFNFLRGIESEGGDLLAIGTVGVSNSDIALVRFNSQGEVQSQKICSSPENQQAKDIIEIGTNEFIIAFLEGEAVNGLEFGLLKIDQNGNQIWEKSLPGYGGTTDLFLNPTAEGFVAAGTSTEDPNQQMDFRLTRLESDGSIIASKTYGQEHPEWLWGFDKATDQGFYLAGFRNHTSIDAYVVKTDSLGNALSNQLSGKVFFDEDEDCQLSGVARDLNSWKVKIIDEANREWLTTTDSTGHYSVDLDTGIYKVLVVPVAAYWTLCEDTITVEFTDLFSTETADFAVQSSIDCPVLDVSISTPFLRRCFDNFYTLTYCNHGTALAEDTYIELTLDPEMTFINSSEPFSSVNGLTYLFEVGDLDVSECGTIKLEVQLGCDSVLIGQTHCVEARIYPDTLCGPPPSEWSGAKIEVDGNCVGDSIFFSIENVGLVPTQGAIDYIVIEDDVILMEDNDVFGALETQQLAFVANGKTYRLEAEQESGFPGMSAPSIAIERCTIAGNNTVSLGYITQFPQDDGDAFVDIDCQENIGSFDPNDKQASPKGVTLDRIISQNQDIEYRIRFQNTGTDTAFNVVIRDTLSEFLDPLSIQIGASSHPFTYTLSGANVLQFQFSDIMLPDSNINEPASHGFVLFRIAQQPDLPFGTIILNDAAIYFDFNAPIITNTTLHTIGELSLLVEVEHIEKSVSAIHVYPNPFSDRATLEVEGMENWSSGELILFTSLGQVVRRYTMPDRSISIGRDALPEGIYGFQITHQGQMIGNGKMIIH